MKTYILVYRELQGAKSIRTMSFEAPSFSVAAGRVISALQSGNTILSLSVVESNAKPPQ